MKNLSNLESTVLLGLNKGDAIKEMWDQILQECEFENLPHSINRALPTVFKAFAGQGDVYNYTRLAGITKKNWVENMRRMQGILPILTLAQQKGIRVVILKGMAISLKNNDFASRVMGDVDLLIKKSDQREMRKILISMGFEPRYRRTCTHRKVTREIFTDAFIDAAGNIIDIHTTGEVDSYYKRLWANSVTDLYNEIAISIPRDSDLLLHSLKHGFRGVAASDLMQTTLDFIALRNCVDSEELMREASNWGLQQELRLLNEFLGIETSTYSTAPVAVRASPIKGVVRFLAVRRDREISLRLANRASKGVEYRRFRYLSWIFLSGTRPLEEAILHKYGGCIRTSHHVAKPTTPKTINNVYPFKANGRDHYEIRFGVEGDFQQLTIDSRGHLFSPHHVFVNGKLAGIIDPNSLLIAHLDPSRNLRHEISIRQPYGRCHECSNILGNSELTLK